MLTAIRQSDNIKVVGDEIEKDANEIYFCDFCDKEVTHNKTPQKLKVGHFKHKPGHSFCPNNTNETAWHLNTKLDILRNIKNRWSSNLKFTGLEVWLANKTIRADIFIETNKGNKIAIEVQASVLSIADIKKRTEKYFKENIYVLWILPYSYERFNYLYKQYGWVDDKTWGVVGENWRYVESVRLKEYEIFLYWCYFKQLIFWDLEHKYSSDFMVIKLSDYITEVVSFYQDGEEQTYGGNKTKTTKAVDRILHNISFDKLKPNHSKMFDVKYRNYVVPERKIFTYDDR